MTPVWATKLRLLCERLVSEWGDCSPNFEETIHEIKRCIETSRTKPKGRWAGHVKKGT